MRAKYGILFILQLVFPFGHSQNLPENSNGVSYSIGGAITYSFISYNFSSIDNRLPKPELMVGPVLEKQIRRNLSIKLGLRIGVKLKTEPFYHQPATGLMRIPWIPYGFQLVEIDAELSSNDHYFAQLPILLVYSFRKIQVGVGGLGRYYLNDFDRLSVNEFGAQATVFYRLTSRLKIGIEYYRGVSNLYPQAFLASTGTLDPFKARNNFLGIGVEFRN